MTNNCSVCKALATNEYVIHSGTKWTVSLAKDQYWLGRSYVTLNSHKSALSELSQNDWLSLAQVINKFESKLKKAYGPDLFNWSCLMNDAYQHHPYESSHVHWHVRPRYSKTINIDGVKFSDQEFGRHYKTRWDGRKDFEISNSLMKKIQSQIEF